MISRSGYKIIRIFVNKIYKRKEEIKSEEQNFNVLVYCLDSDSVDCRYYQ